MSSINGVLWNYWFMHPVEVTWPNRNKKDMSHQLPSLLRCIVEPLDAGTTYEAMRVVQRWLGLSLRLC